MFEINNIFFKKGNKQLYENFSLNVNDQQIITCLYNNNTERQIFLNLLLGNDYPYKGTILLNRNEVTTYTKIERKMALIKPKNILSFFFIPVKLKLMWNSIFDPVFIYNSASSYYYKIAEKKVVTAKNTEQITLLKNLNTIFDEHIKNAIEIRNKNANEFLKKIYNLHIENTDLLVKDKSSSLTKKWISTFLYKKSEIIVNESMLIFFQALFDIISDFKELRLSCDCEENIRKNEIKISKKEFYYYEINNLVDTQLKQISVEIIRKRFEIFTLKKNIKKYQNIIKRNLKKYEKNKGLQQQVKKNVINLQNEYVFRKKTNNPFKFAKELENTFIDQEKSVINNSLPNSFIVLKNKTIELIHKYHLKILDNQIINISKKEYKLQMKILESKYNKKNEFKNIYKKMNKELEQITNKLGIKKNRIFSSLTSPEYSQIIASILDALLANKEILVFDKIFDKLSLKEQEKLKKIVQRIFIFYPKVKIFIISNEFLYNSSYHTKYLLLTDYSNLLYSKRDLSTKYIEHPKNVVLYKSIFRMNSNFIHYKKYKVPNDLSKYLDTVDDLKNKFICINPLYIYFEKNHKDDLELSGKIKSIKKTKLNLNVIKIKINKKLKLRIITDYELNKNDVLKNIYINKKHIIFYNKVEDLSITKGQNYD